MFGAGLGQLVGRVRAKMPGDSLVVAVSTGLGFSVLAGIVSGVCYILTYGIPRKRNRKPITPWHCIICSHQFRSINGVLELEKVVTCCKCGDKICKDKCAKRDSEKGWICLSCRPESWLASLLNALQPSTNKGWYTTKKMNQTTIDEIDEYLLELQKKEREQVRDFIERLVGALLGGDLDNVSVKKLYNDPKYDSLFSRYHADLSSTLTDLGSALHISIANLPISGQSPCSAHASLKLLIQKFIQEAAELPKLQKFEDHPAIPDDTSDRTYEDLLSTAIINKVIQNHQEGTPSSSGSVSSRASTSSRKKSTKEYFFGERNLDSRRIPDDTSSVSSLDEWMRSDSSLGSTKCIDHMSLTIQQRIEEVSSSESEAKDEDEVDCNSLRSTDWQENWMLQRRKFDGTHSPVPVPMLVPNPIAEAKVLIGDREADDTTDLSDAGSDVEDCIEPSSLNAVLVNSKTVIGGRNPLESLVSQAESISEDGTTDDSELIVERGDIEAQLISMDHVDGVSTETMNDALINQRNLEDTSLMSLDSNTEKDLEYTEKYASLPRTVLKNPRPAPRQSKFTEDMYAQKTENVDSGVTSDEDEKQKTTTEKIEDTKPFPAGSYSEREKEKWNNAIEMHNNPYSRSNLERRLSNRSNCSSVNSSYDRDYYIRDASRAAGVKKRSREAAEDEPVLDQSIFKAVPAMVEDEESSLESATPTRPNNLDFSSDSDFSIERTYNVETGRILQKVGSKEVIAASRSPEGIKYVAKPFDVDENQNKLNMVRKKFLRSLTMEDDYVEPPGINHFKLVEDIANETSDQYNEVPLSPPAGYKNSEKDESSILYDADTPSIINETKTESDFYGDHNSICIIDKTDVEHEKSSASINKSPHEVQSRNENNNKYSGLVNKTRYNDEKSSVLIDKNLYENNNNSTSNKIVNGQTDGAYHDDKSVCITPKNDPSDENISLSIIDKNNKCKSPDCDKRSILPKTASYIEDEPIDFSLTYSEISENEYEIKDLKEKHLVRNALGSFSKSYPSLERIEKTVAVRAESVKSVDENIVDEKVTDELPKVRNLTKKFDNNKNAKQEQVYSLTARSIPRQFRQELKQESPPELNGMIKEVPASASSIEDLTIALPSAKSRIDFFEKLKR